MPETAINSRTIDSPDDLRRHLDDLNWAGVSPIAVGVDAIDQPFLITLVGPIADPERPFCVCGAALAATTPPVRGLIPSDARHDDERRGDKQEDTEQGVHAPGLSHGAADNVTPSQASLGADNGSNHEQGS